MEKSVTEKLEQSIRRLNESLVKIGEQTIFSVRVIKDANIAMSFLDEEQVLNALRKQIEAIGIDEKAKALASAPKSTSTDIIRALKEEELSKYKVLFKELLKPTEENANLEFKILNTLENMEKNTNLEKQKPFEEPLLWE